MKTNAFILARAAYAAIEAEVLPVLAQATPLARRRFACVMPVVIPKSLNDPVGFIPRCLNDRRFIFAYAADRGAFQIGVLPSPIVMIFASSASGSSSRKRQTPLSSMVLDDALRSSQTLIKCSLWNPSIS